MASIPENRVLIIGAGQYLASASFSGINLV